MREIKAIPSKSDAHRALICAALGEKPCRIRIESSSADIEATERCLDALQRGSREMYCGESGSTFRFLLPVMGALGCEADFYPEGRLPERPLFPLDREMISHGCTLSPQGQVPFSVRGRLQPGEYNLPGDVSSQYISGLLFALPLLEGDSLLKISGKLQSADYVCMTIRTLQKFGISVENCGKAFRVRGGQKYDAPSEYPVEGDWSNSCFWLAAGALLPEGIRVKGLALDSLQGDRRILEVLRAFGARVIEEEDGITVSRDRLCGIEIDAGQIPDMVPVIAVLAAGAEGETRIENAGRLRIKESDRLRSVTETLRGLGGRVEEKQEGLRIFGTGRLRGGRVDACNDHRIAMMAAIASLLCEGKAELAGADAVKKSYPRFFADLHELQLDQNIERI